MSTQARHTRLQDSLTISIYRKNQVVSLFSHGFIHQTNVASEATTFDWMQPVVPLVQLDWKNF